jgi:hypothetical protein
MQSSSSQDGGWPNPDSSDDERISVSWTSLSQIEAGPYSPDNFGGKEAAPSRQTAKAFELNPLFAHSAEALETRRSQSLPGHIESHRKLAHIELIAIEVRRKKSFPRPIGFFSFLFLPEASNLRERPPFRSHFLFCPHILVCQTFLFCPPSTIA